MADESSTTTEAPAAEAVPMVEAAKLEAALAEVGEWKSRALDAQGKAAERDKFEGDLEKLRGELAAVTEAKAAAEVDRARARVGLAHGLSPEHVDLFLTGTDEGTLEAQAKALVDMRGPAVRAPKPTPDAARAEAPLALNGDIEGALRRRLGL